MWFIKSKSPTRTAVDSPTVAALLDHSLRGRKRHDYRHIPQKDVMSVISKDDIERASKKAFMPYKPRAWECENIAIALLNEAQKIAANEGRSWAMGILRAEAPLGIDGLHVYVWAIIHATDGMFSNRSVCFYDPTAKGWISAADVRNADYSLT